MNAAIPGVLEERLQTCPSWPERFTVEQWSIYKSVMAGAHERGIPFAVGGGLAAMTYAGLWRDTKDIDLYIMKRDRDRLIELLAGLGLQDYYGKSPYDRNWIYRSCKDAIIVDLMWAMANQRAAVDESWLNGPEVEADGVRFRLLAPEEVIWSKLYVLQRDRCDWPDICNLLKGVGPSLDWPHLLRRMGSDARLFGGVLAVYGWLCPEEAQSFPACLWSEVGVLPPIGKGGPELIAERSRLLDSRPWFAPFVRSDPGGAA